MFIAYFSMMRYNLWLLVVAAVLLNSCEIGKVRKKLVYSTLSDSTMYYYTLGWQQIMDFGDYSAAEVSYRKALSFDSDFLVGKSVLARLTTNLDERLELYNELESKKVAITGDERLILDVYIALTKYTNLRDQGSSETNLARTEAFQLSEENLGLIIHKYPQEIYLKSEYIEVLHSLYGAEAALDSIKSLATKNQQENPFILGYKAILTAETKDYVSALKYANRLEANLRDEEVARPDAILANIYFQMEEYEKAKKHADKANSIDPKNVDASRLKEKIDKILESGN